jgi:hypothetical protein
MLGRPRGTERREITTQRGDLCPIKTVLLVGDPATSSVSYFTPARNFAPSVTAGPESLAPSRKTTKATSPR